MKADLNEIVTGDKVIVLAKEKLKLVQVTHVTNTQIHIGTIKYRKNGSEISDKWHTSQIFAPLQKQVVTKDESPTWLACYMDQQSNLKAERQSLIDQISTFDLSKVPTATLKEILSLHKLVQWRNDTAAKSQHQP